MEATGKANEIGGEPGSGIELAIRLHSNFEIHYIGACDPREMANVKSLNDRSVSPRRICQLILEVILLKRRSIFPESSIAA
jgi:hypothetical protein